MSVALGAARRTATIPKSYAHTAGLHPAVPANGYAAYEPGRANRGCKIGSGRLCARDSSRAPWPAASAHAPLTQEAFDIRAVASIPGPRDSDNYHNINGL